SLQGAMPAGGMPQPPGGAPPLPPSSPQGVPPQGMPPAGMAPPAAPMQPPKPPPEIIKYKRITDQRVCVDYVYWEDFIWSPCRVWEERRWVGRAVYLDKQALEKRFGVEKAKKINLTYRPSRMNMDYSTPSLTPEHQAIMQAKIYEIWDRIE